MTDFDYDFFVIGGGSGGVRASRIAAGLGRKTGLAEERSLGGTCVNVGCIPKKLFSYAARYADEFSDAKAYGWEFSDPPAFKWRTLCDNTRREVQRLNTIYASLLEKAGVEVFSQRAKLLDRHTIQLSERTVTAKEILLATGAWPHFPKFVGSEYGISSNEVFELATLPDSVLIVGGGYIAVEFAGIFAGLGVSVNICHRGSSLLRGFDADVVETFTDELRKYAVLRLQTSVTAIEKLKNNGKLRVSFNAGDVMEVDTVLFATGRRPNTTGIGLEQLGIHTVANGAICVDENFTTSILNIHAVGDVIDRVALTPVALAEGQILAQRLFGDGMKKMSYSNIPTAVFSHPNIATVGLDEASSRQKYSNIRVFRSRFTPLLHTVSGRQEKTFLKLIVDADTDKVLGAHMVGAEAGEIIQGIAVAMTAGATKADFDNTLGIHPTVAEEFVTLRTPS